MLILKSGESYKGHYVGKVDEQLVFSIADLNHLFLTGTNMKFPINDVETIVTKNGELTYPFDKEYPRILDYMPESKIGKKFYGGMCISVGLTLLVLLPGPTPGM